MDKKPSSSPFDLALKKMNLLAPACLFVGDNPDRDLKGAAGLGMLTCWAKYGSMRKKSEYEPDYVLDRFEQLLELLSKT
jgi:FMN phosphatase YigB (HAD superfamily)